MWCRTTSARAQLHELTLEMCGLIDDPDCPKRGKHRELEPAQIRKYEEAVQRVILAIDGFTNPWKIPDIKSSILAGIWCTCRSRGGGAAGRGCRQGCQGSVHQ